MTIPDVSKHLGLSWDLIKSIQKKYLEKKYNRPNLKMLERIAIDEIYVGKRGYLTIVLDIDSERKPYNQRKISSALGKSPGSQQAISHGVLHERGFEANLGGAS